MSLLVAVLITSCATAAEPSAGSPSAPGASPSSTDTAPSATPAPVVDIAPAALELTFDGLGSLELGESATQSDLVTFDEDYCAFADYPATDAGRWVAVGESGPRLEPFSVAAAADDTVEAIELRSDTLATDRGIRIGSTAAEFESAYPEQSLFETSFASTVHHAVSGDRVLVVEIARQSADAYWPVEQVATVALILVAFAEPGTQVGSRVASDNVVGGCL